MTYEHKPDYNMCVEIFSESLSLTHSPIVAFSLCNDPGDFWLEQHDKHELNFNRYKLAINKVVCLIGEQSTVYSIVYSSNELRNNTF